MKKSKYYLHFGFFLYLCKLKYYGYYNQKY